MQRSGQHPTNSTSISKHAEVSIISVLPPFRKGIYYSIILLNCKLEKF